MQKSYYFQHDYNGASDAKILFLRQQLGMEGYGIYWFILEQLAQSGGFLPLKIIPVLAMQSQTQETKVNAVISSYDLFQIIDNEFFSVRLNEHLNIRKHLSEKGKQGALKRWANSPPISEPISIPNAKERKESKEIKESKVNSVDLSDTEIQNAFEFVFRLGKADILKDDITNFWEAFKTHKPESFKETRSRQMQHFRDWLKFQKKENGISKLSGEKLGTSAARIAALEKW